MTKHQRGSRLMRGTDVNKRTPVRTVDLEDRHAGDTGSPVPPMPAQRQADAAAPASGKRLTDPGGIPMTRLKARANAASER